MRHFLIDTDAAADDIIALLIALNAPDVAVEAITVVSGACSADQGLQNVLYVLEKLKVNLPVYPGRLAPLFGPLHDAAAIMGKDGLGDIGLPLYGRHGEAVPASDAIRQLIKKHPGELTIVCLGPMTNLALALLVEPHLANMIGRLVVMGGVSDGVGNITAAAEFNVFADPEAARIVLGSGAKVELIGWDLSRTEACAVTEEDLATIQSVGTNLAKFSVDILSGLRAFLSQINTAGKIDFPDPLAMAIAVKPIIATSWVERHVSVVTSDCYARGATIVDHLNAHSELANARIATSADKEEMLVLVRNAVRSLDWDA